MTKYTAGLTPSGAGVALVVALSPYIAFPAIRENNPQDEPQPSDFSYGVVGPGESAPSLSKYAVGADAVSGNTDVIAEFYNELLGKQTSLGSDFEKVLHENLWDLYER